MNTRIFSILFIVGAAIAAPTSVSPAPHYRPDGKSAVAVGGTCRFNRALYSPTHSGFRLECSDWPEFGFYCPRMGGNLLFTLPEGECTARYSPARMDYSQGGMEISAVMMPDADMALFRIRNVSGKRNEFSVRFGGATDKRFSREGDLGVDPVGCFDFKPENCVSDLFETKGNTVTCTYGTKDRKLCTLALPGPVDCPADSGFVAATFELKPGAEAYLSYAPGKPAQSVNLKKAFAVADKARIRRTGILDVETPDEMLNPVGGALAAAADGIWSGEAWLHGAIGWRTPHLGWRGAYTGDAIGWHDRASVHFQNYADNQITEIPAVYQHPCQDSALNLARAEKKWGTPFYSNGYICRRPGHKDEMSHYDMNMVYADAMLRHFRSTGDIDEMRRLFPVLKAHLAWEKLNFDPDGDHLYDAYACIWASDALYYSGGAVTHSTAYNLFANRLAAQVASKIGEDPTLYSNEADAIGKALDSVLWITDKGYWAECKDKHGYGRIHANPAIWTIYHAVDSEVADPLKTYAATCYVDSCIPHIPVGDGLETISTTNWKPYSWSINNVAIAEVMHSALAYWKAHRPDEAYALMKSVMKDNMYDGASPLNFGQISKFDAARGECYRDFADPVGVWSRALVEGLFGIMPDMIDSTPHITLRPGFPSDWQHASIRHSDISYSFEKGNGKSVYRIDNVSRKGVPIWLEVPASGGVKVTVNGKKSAFSTIPFSVSRPYIRIPLEKAGKFVVVVSSTSELTPLPTGKVVKEGSVTFTQYKNGELEWWMPEVSPYTASFAFADGFEDVKVSSCKPMDMSGLCNASVTDIFKNEYLSPRPETTTLTMPKQGIGEWCHPKLTADIDDKGLREALGRNGGCIDGPCGIPFRMNHEGNNILFTSLWDNYPDSVSVPLQGNASHIYLAMAGSTNHMQCGIENGIVRVEYADGSAEEVPLVNPFNWAPIEQDFHTDGGAFSLGGELQPQYRFHLASGRVSRNLSKELNTAKSDNESSMNGVYGHEIPGGAGVFIDIPSDSTKSLKSLSVKTLSNDIIIGLMGITLQR